jgi:hypothetical protein
MPGLSVSEQFAYCTARIECRLSDGRSSIGTGFFIGFDRTGERHIPAIVTNRHVVANAVEGRFQLHVADTAGKPVPSGRINVALENFENLWIGHPSEDVDLCVLPLAYLHREAERQGIRIFLVSLDTRMIPTAQELADLVAIEDVVMVGYPISLWDSVNNFPIFRQGVTATHPATDYEGKREFLVDIACFPGSSGSPVFLYNTGNYATRNGATVIGSRVKLLGILSSAPIYTLTGEIHVTSIPTQQTAISVSQIPINLGCVIRSERLFDFEPVLKRMAQASGTS